MSYILLFKGVHLPNLRSCTTFFFFLQRAGFCFVFLKILFIFREREGKVKERERNINVWLPLMLPLLGTWPATQASALTGNQTGDPLVHSLCSIH